MSNKNIFIALLFFIFIVTQSFAVEKDSLITKTYFTNAVSPDKQRLKLINYTVAATYAGSMTWLYTQWYQNYPSSSFHFFNDDSEWLQMDKYAHAWDAYNFSKPIYHLYRWGGLDNKKATLYATGIAYLYQTTVEVFDGFSSEWGFSTGDILANTGGALTFVTQQLIWEEQRFMLKYSFHTTQFSKYRPDVLGNSLPEKILKDYNGLTYWVTFCPGDFMSNKKIFPHWLNLAVGFGAEGMTGGKENPTEVDGKSIPSFERRRQYYLSLDINFARIQTKSRFLNSLFKAINILHLPAPAIEWSNKSKPIGHFLYF